jgi:hypothetical protein
MFFTILSMFFVSINSFAQVKVGVVFGSSEEQCRGFGLCKMYTYDEDEEIEGLADAIGEIIIEGDFLTLKLDKKSISQSVMDKHLGTYTFFLSQSYILPGDVCAELKIEYLKIPMKEYEIVEEDGRILILFRGVKFE